MNYLEKSEKANSLAQKITSIEELKKMTVE